MEPRALLKSIPGVELLEIPEGDLCCGSAGTYNLEQPEIAAQLGAHKASRVLGLRPDLIAGGNIGCHTQITRHIALQADGESVPPMYHTLEVLDLAYRGEL